MLAAFVVGRRLTGFRGVSRVGRWPHVEKKGIICGEQAIAGEHGTISAD